MTNGKPRSVKLGGGGGANKTQSPAVVCGYMFRKSVHIFRAILHTPKGHTTICLYMRVEWLFSIFGIAKIGVLCVAVNWSDCGFEVREGET